MTVRNWCVRLTERAHSTNQSCPSGSRVRVIYCHYPSPTVHKATALFSTGPIHFPPRTGPTPFSDLQTHSSSTLLQCHHPKPDFLVIDYIHSELSFPGSPTGYSQSRVPRTRVNIHSTLLTRKVGFRRCAVCAGTYGEMLPKGLSLRMTALQN